MLTDAQLRTTAVRLVAGHLTDLDYDQPDVDKLLCRHHCDGADCDRRDEDMAEEIRAVHRHIETIAAHLRTALERYEEGGPR